MSTNLFVHATHVLIMEESTEIIAQSCTNLTVAALDFTQLVGAHFFFFTDFASSTDIQ